jgi:hypothetical protein
MGRAFEVIRTRGLEALFGYFGLEFEPAIVAEDRERITQRFCAEVHEIVRLCTRLRERERFTLFREALRIAYDAAALRRARRAEVSA